MQKVLADTLRAACLEHRYGIQLARPDVYPTDDQWTYIIEQHMGELAARLYRKYLVSWLTPEAERTEYHETTLKRFPQYARTIGEDPERRQRIIDAVYADITSSPDATARVIIDARLFDAPTLLDILHHTPADEPDPVPFVARAAVAYQPEYSAADLDDMRLLDDALNNLSPLGEIRSQRGLFREEKKYICPKGHSNDISVEFCDHPGCGLNIYGLNKTEADAIEDYHIRVSILGSMTTKD